MSYSENRRFYCFDVLRVIATFAVMVLHLSAQHWAGVDVSSRAWFAFNLYDSAVRWAVPVFVMISGALFLGRDVSMETILRKNVLRIVAAFAVWSAAYAVIARIFYGFSLVDTLIVFVQGHYHMWFLYMIVGLYLLIPLLRCFTREEKLMRYFLLLAAVFAYLLPQLSTLFLFIEPAVSGLINTILALTHMELPLGFTIYFVGGYYLSRRDFKRSEEGLLYLLGVAGFLFTVFASRKLSIVQSAPSELFYGYSTINVLFMSAAVFVFARQHLGFPGMSEGALRVLCALSKYSFGAYLVHAMVIEALSGLLHIDTFSCNAFLSVPILAVVVFVISFAVSAGLNQIPFIKKYFV